MTAPVRFRPCEAFAAGAALLHAPERAASLRAHGLLDAFPLGPMRQLAFIVSEVPALVGIEPAIVFEDRWLFERLVRGLRDPWGADDGPKRAFADVVDYDGVARLVAQLTAPMTRAVLDDGAVLLDELETARADAPDTAREDAAMRLHGSRAA